MNNGHIGVLGARSLVGNCLLPTLLNTGYKVTALSREEMISDTSDIEWLRWPASTLNEKRKIDVWISLLPIWVLPEFFPLLEHYGARRVIAVSSTSRFVKHESSDTGERGLAKSLAEGEQQLEDWAIATGTQWLVFRPTLIYGLGRDTNTSVIARFIRRFGFFPLFADGRGFRQPIHASDVAWVCAAAINAPATNRSYNISGGQILTYRDMVIEVFRTLGQNPRFIHLPLWAARLALSLVRLNPRYRHWSAAMFERMGQELVFDHDQATIDFAFRPKGFVMTPEDLPV